MLLGLEGGALNPAAGSYWKKEGSLEAQSAGGGGAGGMETETETEVGAMPSQAGGLWSLSRAGRGGGPLPQNLEGAQPC